METAPLRSFATWARRELITQVSARLTAVLAPASPERVENQRAVTMLERDIAAAGGGAKGKDAVADKVAYTWFNRIIALRFMDANGYTGVGVVSPAHGRQTGQPEILADAKRGSIDPAVVSNKRTLDAITGLLDGTRPSADAQGEAYTLLLAEYCRYWNRSMPFMFEREGDYTELLIPANLLAADSILTRASAALTEEVCREVEVIGWLYQFYISERKDEVFAGFKKGKKAGAAEIPAATQLFTPHWIVRYLVENSVGRLWMLNHPEARLIEQMDYYIAPVDEETDFLKIADPEELTVIDPACGSGHMLTYAFDLLYAIYEEEGYAPSEIPELILTHNLYGTEIDPRAGALAAFALAMKARARKRTFLNKPVDPNICVIEQISFGPDELDFLLTQDGDRDAEGAFWNQFRDAQVLGALIRPDRHTAGVLARHLDNLDAPGDIISGPIFDRASRVIQQTRCLVDQYATVVTNPPYMGNRNMSPTLSSYVKDHYPEGKQDLYGCFILRSIAFGGESGVVAMIVGDTWMSIKSFESLRKMVMEDHAFATFIHCADVSNHPDIFGANAAFVLDLAAPSELRIPYFRLEPLGDEPKRQRFLDALDQATAPYRFDASVADFAAIPGMPVAYRLSKEARLAFSELPSLDQIAFPRVGMQTSNNAKYLRYWWEVSHSELAIEASMPPKWLFYLKGGAFRRWWGNLDYVFHYNRDPSYVLDQPNATVLPLERASDPKITWTDFTSGSFSARVAPTGTFHDISGHCFYPPEAELSWVLGYANSRTFQMFLSTLNSTVHAQVGDIARIPVPHFDRQRVGELAMAAVEISKRDFDRSELSPDFSAPEIVSVSEKSSLRSLFAVLGAKWSDEVVRLGSIETEINEATDPLSLSLELADDLRTEPSLSVNPDHIFSTKKNAAERRDLLIRDAVDQLISYAVGCMFGRYSIDEPGLILADQGATLQDYHAKVPRPTFAPDADNVLPIVDGDWFEDDIVARFRQFLRAAFGEEHFEENLRFVEESLGVKALREYFITRAGKSKFYEDHVQRYKKRPIYWLFSSPKGSFNALIYMHRYTPSTVSTVLNEYLREFESKLEANLQHQERLAAGEGTPREKAAALKEAERLRKVLVELSEYEHDVLYPLASQQVAIDLDDGVKANYPKFYPALKKIAGLEATDD